MEEESQQLHQVVVDVAVLLLHADDVGRVIRFVLVQLVLVEGEEAKLEEVLDDDGDLEGKTTAVSAQLPGFIDRDEDSQRMKPERNPCVNIDDPDGDLTVKR